jgi:hypothetical protein
MRPGTDSHSDGALLAVDARSWRVTHASANLAAFIGIDAALTLGQPLTALLGADATESLRDAIRTRRPCSTGLSLGTAQPPGAENVRLLPFVSSDSEIGIDLIHEDRGNTAEATLIRTRRIVQALRLSRTTIGLSHIHAIRSLDVHVAVDDFGVGQSALSALRRLPADIAKSDRSFLSELDEIPPEDRAFLAAIVALAHTTSFTVAMEGVGTRAQLDAVVEAGVDGVQGYFFGRPMQSEAAVALMCQSPEERGWRGVKVMLPICR